MDSDNVAMTTNAASSSRSGDIDVCIGASRSSSCSLLLSSGSGSTVAGNTDFVSGSSVSGAGSNAPVSSGNSDASTGETLCSGAIDSV